MTIKTTKSPETEKALKGRISGLFKTLQQLAPTPGQKNTNAPTFIKNSDNFRQASEHDSMLGMIMMDAMLGTAFTAANDSSIISAFSALNIQDAAEITSEILTDSAIDDKRGKGTYAGDPERSITNGFNDAKDAANDNYTKDLSKRMQIEEALASADLELNAYYSAPALTLAA